MTAEEFRTKYNLTFEVSDPITQPEIDAGYAQIDAAIGVAVAAGEMSDVEILVENRKEIRNRAQLARVKFWGDNADVLAKKAGDATSKLIAGFIATCAKNELTIPDNFGFDLSVRIVKGEYTVNRNVKSGMGANPGVKRESATGTGRVSKGAEYSNGVEVLDRDAFIVRFYTDKEKQHSLVKCDIATGEFAIDPKTGKRHKHVTKFIPAALERNPGWHIVDTEAGAASDKC